MRLVRGARCHDGCRACATNPTVVRSDQCASGAVARRGWPRPSTVGLVAAPRVLRSAPRRGHRLRHGRGLGRRAVRDGLVLCRCRRPLLQGRAEAGAPARHPVQIEDTFAMSRDEVRGDGVRMVRPTHALPYRRRTIRCPARKGRAVAVAPERNVHSRRPSSRMVVGLPPQP